MKNFFIKTFIYMSVIFLILNVIFLVLEIIYKDFLLTPKLVENAELMSIDGIAPEDTFRVLASYYQAGSGNMVIIQLSLLALSFVYGLAYNLLSFEKKSKINIVLYYLLGLFVISFLPSLRFFNDNFLKEFLYYLKQTYLLYTLVFIVIYSIRIFILRKKTKELNKIIAERDK